MAMDREPKTAQCMIPGLSTLRVIDTADQCIVEAPNPCRYLALSYVWGGIPNFKLRVENKESLMTAGSLTKMWQEILQTIKDAIDLVRKIGERYLWVDSLCLVQDDKNDMERGIGVMDLIYERALMTIVAGAGKHANWGLPGVRDESRAITQRIAEVKPGLRFAVVNELDHCLQLSEYGRRGWT